MGRALLSKALIQLSADGWGCTPSGSCLAWGNPALGPRGSMRGLMANSRRVYAKGDLPGPPSPWWAPADPHLHRRPCNTSREFWFTLPWGHCSSLWVLCVQRCVCVLQDWSLCFPQSSGRPVIKPHWPSRLDSPGVPRPFVGAPGREAWCGAQNPHNSVRTSLVSLCSSLWVTHLVGMDLILLWLLPFHRLTVASSLSLSMGYIFLVGSSVLLSWLPNG